jgi:hypothetical protein
VTAANLLGVIVVLGPVDRLAAQERTGDTYGQESVAGDARPHPPRGLDGMLEVESDRFDVVAD